MRTGRIASRARRGMTFLELLVAALIIAIAAAAAFASWGVAGRAAGNKRVTEMGVYLAVREIEHLKTQKYINLADTAANSPNVSYYDKNGAPVGSATTGGYMVKSWVGVSAATNGVDGINRDGVSNTEDLRGIKVQVSDNSGTKIYDTEQTLLTFGGV
jgi:prepilin-type N-terminal cleavage/methylation domain-containing protein